MLPHPAASALFFTSFKRFYGFYDPAGAEPVGAEFDEILGVLKVRYASGCLDFYIRANVRLHQSHVFSCGPAGGKTGGGLDVFSAGLRHKIAATYLLVVGKKAGLDYDLEELSPAGFLQAAALEKAAKEFTDVKFVFIDGWPLGVDNVAGIAFKEEQCGYFAGYAVVKEGYEKLGFMGGGGGTNEACCRYGYGFVQGANAAAKEMGKKIEVKYTWQYGANFQASPELQTMANGWYTNGTQIIFSCGGSIFDSITAAASANDKKVIGVDVDQSFDSKTVVTSALKGIGAAATWACGKAYDGTWAEIGGKGTSLGAAENATGLPTATWSMKKYTVKEYEAQLKAVIDGTLKIDNAVIAAPNYPQSTDNCTVISSLF